MTAGTQSLRSADSRMIKARSAASAIEQLLGSVVEIGAGGLVIAEIAIRVWRRDLALRIRAAAGLVGRKLALDAVPVAGNARRGDRVFGATNICE